MHRQGKSFQETLNDALRRGLKLSQQPFEVKSRPLRLRQGLDPARLSEMDDDLEIEEFLRKTARLNELREMIHSHWIPLRPFRCAAGRILL